jgi:hypothetical protein
MNLNDAKKLIKESGNTFQSKVINYFRENDWNVLVSPYYVDAVTDKSREIDLIVEKKFGVTNQWQGPPKSVTARLFVECKYIAQGSVFWFDDQDLSRALEWITTNTCFTDNNTYTREHHYLKSHAQVAKLFATAHQKGDENDPLFRTLNQCLNGYIHNRSRELLIPSMHNEIVTKLEYPVIICSDFYKYFRTSIGGAEDPSPITENFAVELNYAYVSNNAPIFRRYFLVDVLAFDLLDVFVAALEAEVAAAKVMVQDN